MLPASASLVRGRGHGDQQRAARPARAQGARAARRGARRHRGSCAELARRLGHDWGHPTAEQVWDELRSLSPMHARHELRRGSRRSAASSGRAPTSQHPGAHVPARAAVGRCRVEGPPAPFSVVEHEPPVEELGRRVPVAADHRAAASSRTTPACRRTATARRCTAARRSTFRPRTPRGCGSRTASSCASRRAAAPSRRRRASIRRCAPGLVFMTLPLPGRGATRTCSRSTPPIRSRARPSSRRARCGSRRSRAVPARAGDPEQVLVEGD